jgi:hypothetical protein
MKFLNSVLFLFLIFLFSCEKNNEIQIVSLNGYVQKGPYLNGTAITISELSGELIPSGKNFSSQILDNKGTFEINNVALSSSFVELKADGFYFNEVTNCSSVAPLTLYVLSDLTDKTSLNVNVLSSLEKRRVEYLISVDSSFNVAKQQAQSEILKIFEIKKEDIVASESLDIMKAGDDNAILLAISIILQGQLSVAELSELLANISTDIRTDGILNSNTLGTILMNNAKNTNLNQVRKNLENRYESLGMDIAVPDFEKYIEYFINHTSFIYSGNPQYPDSGFYGKNILNLSDTIFLCDKGPDLGDGDYCSMKVKLRDIHSKVRVEITGKKVAVYDIQGWITNANSYPYIYDDYVFEAEGVLSSDLKIHFNDRGNATIKIYEDNNTSPTRVKIITLI